MWRENARAIIIAAAFKSSMGGMACKHRNLVYCMVRFDIPLARPAHQHLFPPVLQREFESRSSPS